MPVATFQGCVGQVFTPGLDCNLRDAYRLPAKETPLGAICLLSYPAMHAGHIICVPMHKTKRFVLAKIPRMKKYSPLSGSWTHCLNYWGNLPPTTQTPLNTLSSISFLNFFCPSGYLGVKFKSPILPCPQLFLYSCAIIHQSTIGCNELGWPMHLAKRANASDIYSTGVFQSQNRGGGNEQG